MTRPAPAKQMKLSQEMRDFLRRRTRPFLSYNGVERSLPFLLEEAYLQGIRDVMQVIEDRPTLAAQERE